MATPRNPCVVFKTISRSLMLPLFAATFSFIAIIAFSRAAHSADDESKTGKPSANEPEKNKGEEPAKAEESKTDKSRQGPWSRAKAASLTFSLAKKDDLHAKLDEEKSPKLKFDEKTFKEHMAKAADAYAKENFKLAKMRTEVKMTSFFGLSINFSMHLFKDSETDWPNGDIPLAMRTHGVRAPNLPGGGSGDNLQTHLGNAQLALVIAALTKEINGDKFDLLLIGEKLDDDGTIRGKLCGTLTTGETVTDITFALRPLRDDGQPLSKEE